ncbi:hypothetical protein [Wohlfahrtiimonas larvae]|uniref:DUF262 domain-containing protein n=1 Tax=Wohlfahrtiimonas larvae TaxID=1157986 RepID=A0ABP9MX53_9GAMM|nr:hypothetical protein [Wohlfahrtiimonas larvae]
MAINVFEIGFDKVIDSSFIVGSTNYSYAISHLSNLIEKLEIQRKLQQSAIYKRLEQDILRGCVMPPITVAFVDEQIQFRDEAQVQKYIEQNIQSAFILDGIQRLNLLKKIEDQLSPELLSNGLIVLNILICPSMDKLLYRMVTLNNGQKPMSPAHQIEILTSADVGFEELSRKIKTEKDGYSKDSLNKSDLVKAYIAFLGNSVNIDNQKIIQSKLDELIAENIIESFGYENERIEFKQVIQLISDFSSNKALFNWFRVGNNLIGFCVGISKGFQHIRSENPEMLRINLEKLEIVFGSIDKSKIRVSTFRRTMVKNFIENYGVLKDKSENEILDFLTRIV